MKSTAARYLRRTKRQTTPARWKRRAILLGSIASALGLSVLVKAAPTYTWDPNVNGNGGSGTWDTTSQNWLDSLNARQPWNNNFLEPLNAVFGGTGGLVTLSNGAEAILAGGLTFNANGYTVAGGAGESLMLATDGLTIPTISVTNASHTATISALLDGGGSGFTKLGLGTLELTRSNIYTGTTTVAAGVLRTTSFGAFGFDGVRLAGGELQVSTDANTSFANDVTVAAGSAQITTNRLTAGAGVTHSFQALNLGAQTLNVQGGNLATSGTQELSFGILNLTASGATVNTTNGTGGATTQTTLGGVGGSAASVAFGGTGNTLITGAITTGTGSVTKNGPGTLTLQGVNTYTGGTIVNAGAVTVDTAGSLSATTPVTVTGGTLNFLNSGQTIASFTLGGGAMGTTATVNLGGGAVSLAGNVTYAPANNSGGATITGAGGLALGANRTFAVGDGSAFADLTISTPLSTGTLVKTGAGLLLLTNANSSAIIGQGGVIRATDAGALGTSLTTNTAASEVQLAGDTALAFTADVTVNTATLLSPTRQTAGGSVTHTLGALAINNALTVAPGAHVNAGTAGVGFGAVSLTGAATINTNNSFFNPAVTGQTTLASITGTQALTVGGTGSTTVTGNVTTATGTLTKTGTGTLTLSGAANTNTGLMTVSAGTLAVASGGGWTGAGPAITFAGSGTFNFNAAPAAVNQAFGALTFSAGDGTVLSTYGASTGLASITFASLAARAPGATGNFVITGGSATNRIMLGGVAPNSFINAGEFFNGADYAFYDTGAFVRALNYGTDPNTNTVAAAATTLTGASHNQINASSGTAGTVNLTAASSISSLKMLSGTTLNTSTFLVTTPAVLLAGGGAGTISGTGGISTGAATDLIVRTDALGDTLTVSAPITSTSTGGVTKTGAGKLILSNAANAFTGDVRLNAGTLEVSMVAGTNTVLGGQSGTVYRQVILNNGATFRSLATFNDNAPSATNVGLVFNFGAGGGTLDVNTGTTLTLDDGIGAGTASTNAQLQGSGDLTKIGAGTLTLGTGTSDFSNYTGRIFVNAGTLTINGVSPLGATSAPTVIASGAALDLAGSATAAAEPLTVSGTGIAGAGALLNSSATASSFAGPVSLGSNINLGISAAGSLTLSGSINDHGLGLSITRVGAGAGNLVLSGANTFSGGLILSTGTTLLIGNAAALGTGAVTVNAASTLAANGAAAVAPNNNVVLNADVTLGAAATNTGALTLGGLNLGATTRTLTVNSPAANAVTFAGTVSGAGGLTMAGLGTLALTGTNTYTGATIANGGGTLSVGAGALAATSGLTVGSSVNTNFDLLADGVGAAATLAPGANVALGSASSFVRLGMQLGPATAYDSLNTSGGGSFTAGAAGVFVNPTILPGFGSGVYTLINAPGGLTGASNIVVPLANLPTGSKYALSSNATSLTLTATPAAPGNFYWVGDVAGNSWRSLNAGGTNSNWATDIDGTLDAGNTPGALNTVNFSATNASATPFVTTLDQNYSVQGLVFLGGTPGAVTINQGTFGALTLGSGGLIVQNPVPAPTINAPVVLGAAQTWQVNGGAQVAVNGNVSGPFAITKDGGGALALGGFNTYTGGVTLNNGLLSINNGGTANTNSALGTGPLAINGGALDNTSGAAVALLTTGAQTWNGDFQFVGSNSLSLGTGTVALGANRTVTVDAKTLQVGGVVSGAGFRLTKAGAGALTLSGVNTFTGGVTLDAGTININNASALGTVAGTFIINGGTIDNTNGGGVTAVNYLQQWNGDFAFGGNGALSLGTGAVTLGGDRTLTVNSPAFAFNTPSLTVGGIVSGAGFNLTKAGAGSLVLSGANTFGGTSNTVTLQAGTLSLGNIAALGAATNKLVIQGGALDVTGALAITANYPQQWDGDFYYLGTNTLNTGPGAVALGASRQVTVSGSTLTVPGIISGAGFGLTKTGAGTMVLSGANTYSGATTVNGGVLTINTNTAGTIATTGVSFTGTGTFNTDNALAAGPLTPAIPGALTFTAGDGTVLSTRTANQNTTLTFNSLAPRAAGATGNFAVTGTGSSLPNNKVVFATAPTPGQIIDRGLFASGADFAVYDAANGIRVPVYGTDTNTAAQAGAAAFGAVAGKDVNLTGAITAQNADISLSTLKIGGAFGITLNSGITLTTGAILKSGGSAATIGGATGILSNGGNELVVRTDVVTTDVLTVAAALTGAGGLTKTGAGTLVLSGANTFAGNININAGVLTANGIQALNNAATQTVTMAGGTTLNLRVDGNANGAPETLALGDNYSLIGAGTVTLNYDRLGGVGLNKTLQLGGLTMGNQTLAVTPAAAANGYGIQFAGPVSLSSTPIFSVTGNTSVASNVVQALTLSGQVSGSATSIAKTGTGSLVLSNPANDFTGNIVVTGGVLAFNSDGALGASTNSLSLNGTTVTLRAQGGTPASPIVSSRAINFYNTTIANNVLEVTAGNAWQLNAPFGPANIGFTKADNGLLVLNADNGLWSGAINIAAGALRVTNNGALGSAAAGTTVAANVGAALQLGGVTITDPLSLNNTGINTGGALQAVSGSNTVNGLVTLATATAIGADAGSTLNVNGGVTGALALTLAGGGNINFTTNPIAAIGAITKIGTGTTTIAVPSPAFVAAMNINAGTVQIGGPLGGAGSIGGAGLITVNPGGALSVDDSVGLPVTNRLGGRALTLLGGAFNYTGGTSTASFETLGALTTNAGQSVVTITPGAGQQSVVTFASIPAAGAGGTALFRGTGLGNVPGAGVPSIFSTAAPVFVGQAGAAGTTSKAILPWALIDSSANGDGTSFATSDGANGMLRALTASEQAASLTYGAPANTALAANATLPASATLNSLKLTGSGVSIEPMQVLTLGTASVASGGLLALGSNNTLAGGFVSGGGLALYVHTPGGASELTMNSALLGTAGLNKAGAGSLTVSQPAFYTGQTTVNQGTLKLAAGTNSLVVGIGQTGQALVVNTGGTLDLNGNVQVTGTLSSTGAAIGAGVAGGSITTSSAGGTLVANSGAASFAGNISGTGVNFMRSGGASIFNILTPQTYTGATVINGGGLTTQSTTVSTLNGVTLTDNGSLASTSITLNYASLNLNNATGTLADSTARLNPSAAINLSGGNLNFFGRGNTLSRQNVGAVTLVQGNSVISASNGNGTAVAPQSATLTMASLSRDPASGATVQFAQNFQNTSTGALGLLGANSENIIITAAPSLSNNLIGPWATVVGGYFITSPVEFASYNPTLGVGALNAAGFAGYDGTALVANQPLQNIRIAGTALPVPAGGSTVNSLNVANSTVTPVSMTFTNAADVLNVRSGGLLVQNVIAAATTTTIGGAVNSGVITAGGATPVGAQDLFLTYIANGAGALTVNSAIKDNGGSAVRLITSGGNYQASNITLAGTNTYSGGTVVNGEIVTIAATGTLPAPTSGTGLTINGGTVNSIAADNAIAAQSVALNGGSTLNLTGRAHTLSSLTFNSNGGAAPTISNAGTLLTLTGNITAASSNINAPSAITAGTIELGAGPKTITVHPVTFDGTAGGTVISPYTPALNIAAILQSAAGTGSLVKTGAGNLQLGGVNTFAGGVDLQQGGLILNVAAALGTGPLTLSGSSISLSASAAITAANQIIWGPGVTSMTYGQPGSAALTLTGLQGWGTGVTRTLISNAVSGTTFTAQTLGGQIVGSGGLIKEGLGTINLTGGSGPALDFTGSQAWQVKNGTLQFGNDAALGLIPASPVADNILIDGGVLGGSANFTLNPNRGIKLGGLSSTASIDAVAATTFVIPGVISGSATLSKTGAGTVALTGVNTYTGQTLISTGALELQNTHGLGDTAAGTAVFNGGALNLNNSLVGGGIFVTGEPLTLSGTGVANAGALRNVGGPNTYAAPITLDASARINSDAGHLLITSAISGNNAAGLTLGGVGNLRLAGAIGAGVTTLTKDGAGTATLGTANGYTGLTTISAGALRVENSSALGTAGAGTTVTAGGALEIDGTGGALIRGRTAYFEWHRRGEQRRAAQHGWQQYVHRRNHARLRGADQCGPRDAHAFRRSDRRVRTDARRRGEHHGERSRAGEWRHAQQGRQRHAESRHREHLHWRDLDHRRCGERAARGRLWYDDGHHRGQWNGGPECVVGVAGWHRDGRNPAHLEQHRSEHGARRRPLQRRHEQLRGAAYARRQCGDLLGGRHAFAHQHRCDHRYGLQPAADRRRKRLAGGRIQRYRRHADEERRGHLDAHRRRHAQRRDDGECRHADRGSFGESDGRAGGDFAADPWRWAADRARGFHGREQPDAGESFAHRGHRQHGGARHERRLRHDAHARQHLDARGGKRGALRLHHRQRLVCYDAGRDQHRGEWDHRLRARERWRRHRAGDARWQRTDRPFRWRQRGDAGCLEQLGHHGLFHAQLGVYDRRARSLEWQPRAQFAYHRHRDIWRHARAGQRRECGHADERRDPIPRRERRGDHGRATGRDGPGADHPPARRGHPHGRLEDQRRRGQPRKKWRRTARAHRRQRLLRRDHHSRRHVADRRRECVKREFQVHPRQ